MKVLPAAMLAVALLVAACGKEQVEPPADAADPTESLHALFDEFFERSLELWQMVPDLFSSKQSLCLWSSIANGWMTN